MRPANGSVPVGRTGGAVAGSSWPLVRIERERLAEPGKSRRRRQRCRTCKAWRSAVKGSRVQISPTREHDVGSSHLITAGFSRPSGPSSTSLSAGELGPDWATTRVGRSGIEDGLVVRVETTARHSRVLTASHRLEQV